jgi:hypothetical protein
VGLRLLKPQGVLFRDGSDRHFHAIITNKQTDGGRLITWHREKTGTVEHTHDEVKNELGGGHMPSQRFGVNSAWFKLSMVTYNIISAMKGLCLEEPERTARRLAGAREGRRKPARQNAGLGKCLSISELQ